MIPDEAKLLSLIGNVAAAAAVAALWVLGKVRK